MVWRSLIIILQAFISVGQAFLPTNGLRVQIAQNGQQESGYVEFTKAEFAFMARARVYDDFK